MLTVPSNRPESILLHGQSGVGKTMALQASPLSAGKATDFASCSCLCLASYLNELQAVMHFYSTFMLTMTASSIQTAFPEDLKKGLRGVFDMAYELSQRHHCCIVFGKRVPLM